MVSGIVWVQMVLASACFAVGGIFMKLSDGVSRPLPSAAFLLLFLLGAVLQSVALRRADLGVVYIAVLGLEAALTLVFSVLLFRESLSFARVLAVLLIVAGVLLLRRE
ncbi:DMT family transporter [Archangium violaceum]|uniref:DMT family transporter n=1 Tax=Archangium violaceum TaxID=83451 RepID=UPI001EF4D3A3|nr:SMR family transporter [Archangium violaceum]